MPSQSLSTGAVVVAVVAVVVVAVVVVVGLVAWVVGFELGHHTLVE